MLKADKEKKVRGFLAFCRELEKGELSRIINQLELIRDDKPQPFNGDIEETTC